MKKLKESEKDIQKAILEHLTMIGAVPVKFNNVGIRKADGGYIPPRELGISDILACYKGRFLAVEVKSTGNKPTENQLNFLSKVRSSGGFATWVDSLTDYFKFMQEVNYAI